MSPPSLPEPDAADAARSAELGARLRARIDQQGAIDFSEFMRRALYEPGLGYYSAPQPKFGAAGDFVTAPELGGVFGIGLARQCAQVLREIPNGVILEAGAGRGTLAAQLLAALDALNALPQEYWILELSGALAAEQRHTLQTQVPQLAPRVRWLTQLPDSIRGVVLGNEVLDAMPVERFRVTASGIEQLQVTWKTDGFAWATRRADPTVVGRVQALDLAPGYCSEIGFEAEAWVHTLGARLEQGALLLFDYGFPRAEFYHPDRRDGTLMCHYRHRAHPDPLQRVGLQDITAHIDFTAVAEAAHAAGLDVLGYTSQAAFLIGCGLEAILAQSDPTDIKRHATLTAEIQRLTSPAEMGELFKAIALGRGLTAPLAGFQLQDRRGRL
jgi:SAM-dependent MidA family methyltransferase